MFFYLNNKSEQEKPNSIGLNDKFILPQEKV